MPDFPKLGQRNASIFELKEWLEGQREKVRDELETATDRDKALSLQGRVGLIKELLTNIDPKHRQIWRDRMTTRRQSRVYQRSRPGSWSCHSATARPATSAAIGAARRDTFAEPEAQTMVRLLGAALMKQLELMIPAGRAQRAVPAGERRQGKRGDGRHVRREGAVCRGTGGGGRRG